MKELNTESTVFVSYKLENGEGWTYNLPKGWWWVGSGSTEPVNSKCKSDYPREEQFSGPKETRDKTKTYLENVFQKLKTKNIIGSFKIRNSYLP